jgi:uncharacterized membrane protein
MTTGAMFAVLLGALMHAGWNALIKGGNDKFLDTVLVVGGAALWSLLALMFVPAPAPASWPNIAISISIHVLYYSLVAAAYRTGDMSHAYPIMRGTAPLIVAILSGVVLGEALGLMAWTGVILICGSILLLAFLRSKAGRGHGQSTAFALGNAVVIACYTFNDAAGVRLSGSPVGYNAWLFILTALPMLVYALKTRRQHLVEIAIRRWPVAMIGGLCTAGSYGLALWAMLHAPVATVSALRETSILFGMLLAAFLLRERIGLGKIAAGLGIAAGGAALRLAG